jgi:hypothetical protein
VVSNESVKDIFKSHTLKQPKLGQLDKVVYKWFTAMHLKVKPMTLPTMIEKLQHFL